MAGETVLPALWGILVGLLLMLYLLAEANNEVEDDRDDGEEHNDDVPSGDIPGTLDALVSRVSRALVRVPRSCCMETVVASILFS